jgi:hypothetical protein
MCLAAMRAMRRIPVVFATIVVAALILVTLRGGHPGPIDIEKPPSVMAAETSPPANRQSTRLTIHSSAAFEDALLNFPPGLRIEIPRESASNSSAFDLQFQSDSGTPVSDERAALEAPLAVLRGLLPTSGSEPPLAAQLWNHPDVRWGNNCYAYACDDPNPFRRGQHDFPQPGNAAGLDSPDPFTYTCALLRSRAIADGLIAVPAANSEKPAPDGFYKVALFVAPGRDYHWYRQDPGGYWSHKLGGGPIRLEDASGRRIADPRLSDRSFEKLIDPQTNEPAGQNYNLFGGFFLVPQGGIHLMGFHHAM